MSSLDIGIDLGTTSVIVYMHGKGIILREPSVVAVDTRNDTVIAVGKDAFEMVGKTPAYISAVHPLKDGVISDHVLTEYMIKEFLRKTSESLMIKPRVAICVPSAITDVESRAVIRAATSAGARKVYLVEEPIAAAIGAGVNISEANGALVVDIGGGTTDVAIISLSGIVQSDSIKIAGNTFDEAIVKYLRHKYKLLIGERMAEKIKIELADVFHVSDEKTMDVKGRNLVTGLPQRLTIAQSELLPCLRECCLGIINSIRRVLELAPPELVGYIHSNGIILTGGGSLLCGLDKLIASYIKVEVRRADTPTDSVAIGTGNVFDFISDLNDGFVNASTYEH